MNRRKFLKACGVAGLSAGTPAYALASSQLAALCNNGGHPQPSTQAKFFINVIADGGWDPSHFCDPKENIDAENPINTIHDMDDVGNPFSNQNSSTDPGRTVTRGNITFNNIKYPYSYTYTQDDGQTVTEDREFLWADFLDRHYQKMLVLNGAWVGSLNHATANKVTWSGLKNRTYPSLAALHAATRSGLASSGQLPPMPYLSYGGYDKTVGEIALTRIGTSSHGLIGNLIASNANGYQNAATQARIIEAAAPRLQRLHGAANVLPRARRNQLTLFAANVGQENLSDFHEAWLQAEAEGTPYEPSVSSNKALELKKQARFALAAFKTGVSCSANLTIGSFDSHSNFNYGHTQRMAELLDGVDYLLQEAERQDLLSQTVILVSSEFGRTNKYNDRYNSNDDAYSNGKDHWSNTSAMLFGAGIEGNRIVGQTDEALNALAVQDASGQDVTLSMEAVNHELRDHLGINSALKEKYPLMPSDIGFFDNE